MLTDDACSQLIHSLVTVRIDYCNSLLYGMPDSTLFRLQKVLNTAARIQKKIPKFSHITGILKDHATLDRDSKLMEKSVFSLLDLKSGITYPCLFVKVLLFIVLNLV